MDTENVVHLHNDVLLNYYKQWIYENFRQLFIGWIPRPGSLWVAFTLFSAPYFIYFIAPVSILFLVSEEPQHLNFSSLSSWASCGSAYQKEHATIVLGRVLPETYT